MARSILGSFAEIARKSYPEGRQALLRRLSSGSVLTNASAAPPLRQQGDDDEVD